ncbi:MAG: MAPEG family protein [Gammaproteobacteria bacterium]|nr:MAPEG family protein [Gammaproteobacteria bacterium]
MISVIYAVIAAALIIFLSFKVIKTRRRLQISVGDGNNEDLQTVQGAQSNAIEYLPIALLLLFYLEYNGANIWLIHLAGITLMTGRIVHARGLLQKNLKRRVLGMQITIYALIGLCLLNIAYLPLDKLLGR